MYRVDQMEEQSQSIDAPRLDDSLDGGPDRRKEQVKQS